MLRKKMQPVNKINFITYNSVLYKAKAFRTLFTLKLRGNRFHVLAYWHFHVRRKVDIGTFMSINITKLCKM